MKRQKIIVIVCGTLMGAVCLGAGWFLYSAMSVSGAAAEERNQAFDELRRIYNAKVFPNDENIARVSEDQKALEAWLVAGSNLVHKGDLKIEEQTPAGFKQRLQSVVRALSAQPGTVKGKVVESGFRFGFDKYLGESDSLPTQEHVGRLTQQLAVIEKVCKELYAANILCLEKVSREAFDEAKAEGDEGEPEVRKSRKRPRKGDKPAPGAAAAAAGAADSEFHSKQRFTFVFQARPSSFVEALNRLAAMELFVVVAETEFNKTSDPLLERDARRRDRESPDGAAAETPANAAQVDLTKVPHAERIVSDPELEPPVSVKLDIDVYSFEGV